MFTRVQPGHEYYDISEDLPTPRYRHQSPAHPASSASRSLPSGGEYFEHHPAPHRHQPYPTVSRPPSSHSRGPHLNRHRAPTSLPPLPLTQPSRRAIQSYWSPQIQSSDKFPVSGGSTYGQISLLADVAMREAEDGQGRTVGSSSPNVSAHNAPQGYGRGELSDSRWYQGCEDERKGDLAAYPQPTQNRDEAHSQPIRVHVNSTGDEPVASRHPLSGLSLDKYSSYTPTKFEENVRKVLSTPTFTHAPPQRSRSSLLSPSNSAFASTLPPQWPPHQSQVYGRADPEKGRAWTFSLEPAHRQRPSTSPLERKVTRSGGQFPFTSTNARSLSVASSIPNLCSTPSMLGDQLSLPNLTDSLPSVSSMINGHAALPKPSVSSSLPALVTSHPSSQSSISPIRPRTPSADDDPVAKRAKLRGNCESLQSTQTSTIPDERDRHTGEDGHHDVKKYTKDSSAALAYSHEIDGDRNICSQSDDGRSLDVCMRSSSPRRPSLESAGFQPSTNGKRPSTRAHSSSLSSAASAATAPIKLSKPMVSPSPTARPRRANSEGVKVESGKRTIKRGGPRRKYQNKVAAKRHRDKKKMLAEQMEGEVHKYRMELEKRESELRSIRMELEAALSELERYRKSAVGAGTCN